MTLPVYPTISVSYTHLDVYKRQVYARHAKERAAQNIRGETAAKTLARVNAEARAAHVSYGQYAAIQKDAAARHLPPQEIEAKLRWAARW